MDMKKMAGAAVLAAGLLLGGVGSAWAAHLEDIAARGLSGWVPPAITGLCPIRTLMESMKALIQSWQKSWQTPSCEGGVRAHHMEDPFRRYGSRKV